MRASQPSFGMEMDQISLERLKLRVQLKCLLPPASIPRPRRPGSPAMPPRNGKAPDRRGKGRVAETADQRKRETAPARNPY